MYDLVCDVDRYQEFLPWCSSSKLISRSDEKFCGELEVSRVGISQTFRTCNTVIPGERVNIELENGPFRHMHGYWHFHNLRDDACKVELELDFEFSGKLITAAFGVFFTQAANSMVDAFCKRADDLYRD